MLMLMLLLLSESRRENIMLLLARLVQMSRRSSIEEISIGFGGSVRDVCGHRWTGQPTKTRVLEEAKVSGRRGGSE